MFKRVYEWYVHCLSTVYILQKEWHFLDEQSPFFCPQAIHFTPLRRCLFAFWGWKEAGSVVLHHVDTILGSVFILSSSKQNQRDKTPPPSSTRPQSVSSPEGRNLFWFPSYCPSCGACCPEGGNVF